MKRSNDDENFNKRLLRGLDAYSRFENSRRGHALFSLFVTGFIVLVFIAVIVLFILNLMGIVHVNPICSYRYSTC